MILPRVNEQSEGVICPPGHTNCTSVTIITGAVDGNNVDGSNTSNRVSGPPGYEKKPGAHRYIGVGMAAGMVLLVLVLWLTLGKWPRRMAKAHCCCYRRKVVENGEESVNDGRKNAKGQEEKSNCLTSLVEGQKAGVELEYTMAWKIPQAHVRASHD
jgi:hypothetical protein